MDDCCGEAGWAVDDINITGIGAGAYQSPGYYVSNVYDAGSSKTWETLTWSFDKPANTDITIKVRAGETEDLSGVDWSSAYSTSPVSLTGITGRYIQYRVDMSTTDDSVTPHSNQTRTSGFSPK